jgi:hypothetical protein
MSTHGNSWQLGAGAGAMLRELWTTDPRIKEARERVLANPAAAPHLWAIFADCTLGSVGLGNHAENEPFTVLTAAGRMGRR